MNELEHSRGVDFVADTPSSSTAVNEEHTETKCESTDVTETVSKRQKRVLAIPLPPSVVRSFLDDGTRSLTELRDVSSLFEVAERASVIVKECRVPILVAFYFCVDVPYGNTETFLELKRLMKRVFRIEGHRIMHMLEEDDREMLLETPLADVVEEFRNRDSRAMILAKLRTLVPNTKASEILNHESCVYRISIGGEEGALARELVEFWNERNHTEPRKERLELAFASKGMTMRSTCPLCNAYIAGEVHAHVDDVIGLSIIASRLRGRQKDFITYFASCEEEFKHHLHNKRCDLSTAIREAMRTVKQIDKKRHKQIELECTTKSAFLTFL
eukprot:g7771.t1